MDHLKKDLTINTITVKTNSTNKIMNAINWLEENNIDYNIDFNWPCSYYDFKFNNKNDASFFALKWS